MRYAALKLVARGVVLVVCVVGGAGCAQYQIGARTMYAPDVHTVYVPMFESDSFRRNLGELLTEAVVKEIELKTPYKVVNSPNADSILSGRIVADEKRVLIETTNDDPRTVEMNLVVDVTWIDRRGDMIRGPTLVPLPPDMVEIGQTSTLVAEVGQSIASAQQLAITRLAEQIVATMEAPW
jgi:hypothetical protein